MLLDSSLTYTLTEPWLALAAGLPGLFFYRFDIALRPADPAVSPIRDYHYVSEIEVQVSDLMAICAKSLFVKRGAWKAVDTVCHL